MPNTKWKYTIPVGGELVPPPMGIFFITMNKLFEFDHTIKSNGKEHLSEIIPDEEYKKWFNTRQQGKIIVLNKGRCGNGGTTGFISYEKKKID